MNHDTPFGIWSTTPPHRPGLCWVWMPGEDKPQEWPVKWHYGVDGDLRARDRSGWLLDFPLGTRFCLVAPPETVSMLLAQRESDTALIRELWPHANNRRIELILQMSAGPLGASEAADYESLQDLATRTVDRITPPLPNLPAHIEAAIDAALAQKARPGNVTVDNTHGVPNG